jgi:hypothetical protein
MFLKFIGFIFLFFVIATIIGLVRIYLTVRRMHKSVKERFGQGQRDSKPEGETTYGSDGSIITDTRKQSRSEKKIFDNDDGEYVDYVEEK